MTTRHSTPPAMTRATMTKCEIAQVFDNPKHRIAYNEADLRRVQRYLRGGQTCAEFDVLDSYTMALVDTINRVVKE
jgi:hypothetical protein